MSVLFLFFAKTQQSKLADTSIYGSEGMTGWTPRQDPLCGRAPQFEEEGIGDGRTPRKELFTRHAAARRSSNRPPNQTNLSNGRRAALATEKKETKRERKTDKKTLHTSPCAGAVRTPTSNAILSALYTRVNASFLVSDEKGGDERTSRKRKFSSLSREKERKERREEKKKGKEIP